MRTCFNGLCGGGGGGGVVLTYLRKKIQGENVLKHKLYCVLLVCKVIIAINVLLFAVTIRVFVVKIYH